MFVVYGVNLLAFCLISKPDNHPLSAVYNCLFNIYIYGLTCHAVVTFTILPIKRQKLV